MAVGYYVSVIHGRSKGLLLGPYDDHPTALNNVERGKELVLKGNDDPENQAWWYAYGTCKIESTPRPKSVFGK